MAVDRVDRSAGARWRGQEHGPQPEARVQAALAALMGVATRRERLRAQLLAQRGSARRAGGRARAAGMIDLMRSPTSPEKVTSTMTMAARGKLTEENAGRGCAAKA